MSAERRHPARSIALFAVLAILFAAIFLLLATTSPGHAGSSERAILSPLPERTRAPEKPATWVFAANGGEVRFGSVTIAAPAGFTKQSGADIRANLLPAAENLVLPPGFVSGTLFAVGIWPPNDQTQFEQPLDLRLLLDPVTLPEANTSAAQFVQYDPAQKKWVPLDEAFRRETYELVTQVKTFTPVAKDFPVWGGRTFFAVVRSASAAAGPANAQPTVLRQANIRSGPGTTYSLVRTARAGEVLELDGRSVDGRWLRLADGAWIAAFLVANAPQLPTVDAE